jgi:hypothetical protein
LIVSEYVIERTMSNHRRPPAVAAIPELATLAGGIATDTAALAGGIATGTATLAGGIATGTVALTVALAEGVEGAAAPFVSSDPGIVGVGDAAAGAAESSANRTAARISDGVAVGLAAFAATVAVQIAAGVGPRRRTLSPKHFDKLKSDGYSDG